MSFEMTGTLYEIFPSVQRTSTFKIREFVVERVKEIGARSMVDYVKFQTTQDRTDLLDKFNKGDQVKVHFNIRGSKVDKGGNVSYFNNLDVWRMEHALKADQAGQPIDRPAPDSFSDDRSEGDDMLPF